MKIDNSAPVVWQHC